MSPTELWWWIEFKMGITMVGKNLTEDEADSLYQLIKDKGL